MIMHDYSLKFKSWFEFWNVCDHLDWLKSFFCHLAGGISQQTAAFTQSTRHTLGDAMRWLRPTECLDVSQAERFNSKLRHCKMRITAHISMWFPITKYNCCVHALYWSMSNSTESTGTCQRTTAGIMTRLTTSRWCRSLYRGDTVHIHCSQSLRNQRVWLMIPIHLWL